MLALTHSRRLAQTTTAPNPRPCSDGLRLARGVTHNPSPVPQDVALSANGASSSLAPEAMRRNVAGLSVEYVRREGPGSPWGEKGLLDFNILHGDWPSALPDGPGAAPARSQFALLKEGGAWYDPSSRTLIALRFLGGCDGPAGLQPYNYSALDYYGYRGEWPRGEFFQKADYTGEWHQPAPPMLRHTCQ
jgi:hypothetical protein